MTDPATVTVYALHCPCDAPSGECASSEFAERRWITHVTAQHPERLDEVRDHLLAGRGQPHHIGHVDVDEDGTTAWCGACAEVVGDITPDGAPSARVVDELCGHWHAAHLPR